MVGSSILWKVRLMFEAQYLGSVIAEVFSLVQCFVLVTFPGWQDEVDETGSEREIKPFPSKTQIYSYLALSCAASLLFFTSTLWQHSSAVSYVTALQIAFEGAIVGRVGVAAMALGWVGTVTAVLMTVGASTYIVSVWALNALTLDGEGSPMAQAPARAGFHEDE